MSSAANRSPIPAPLVTLRQLIPSDRENVRRWMQDPAVVDFTVLVPGPECVPVLGYGNAGADRYFHALMFDHERRAFAVLFNGTHVGNVGLRDLNLDRGTSECFIELGELGARGHGVGHEAMRQALNYAFFDLGLNAIRLGVFDFNGPAIRLYQRLGFSDAGTYGWHWRDGRYCRVLGMQLEQEDWPGWPVVPSPTLVSRA